MGISTGNLPWAEKCQKWDNDEWWGKRSLRSKRICQWALQEKTLRETLSNIVINSTNRDKNAICWWHHGVSWEELTVTIRDGSSAQDRYREGPQSLHCTGQRVFWDKQNENWKRVSYKASQSFKEWRCSKRALFKVTRRGRRLSQGRAWVRELLCCQVSEKKWRKSPLPERLSQETEKDAKDCSGKNGPNVG